MSQFSMDLNEFDPASDAALIAWLDRRWKTEKGGGVDLKLGKINLRVGYNGSIKWKNVGVGLGLLVASSAVVQLASGGAYGFPWWGTLLTMSAYTSAAPAFEGGAAAWNKARADGAGPLSAFGALCKRYGLKLTGLGAPGVFSTLPLLASVGVFCAGSATKAALTAVGAVKAAQFINPAVVKMAQTAQKCTDLDENFAQWKAGLLVKAARLDGASDFLSSELYSDLAKLRMRARWELVSGSEIAAAQAPSGAQRAAQGFFDHAKLHHAAEFALRKKFERLARQASLDEHYLLTLLDKVDAAGVPAWFSPEPGMPSLGALARSVGQRHAAHHGPDINARLEGLWAQEEAHAIAGFVPEAPAPAQARKVRL